MDFENVSKNPSVPAGPRRRTNISPRSKACLRRANADAACSAYVRNDPRAFHAIETIPPLPKNAFANLLENKEWKKFTKKQSLTEYEPSVVRLGIVPVPTFSSVHPLIVEPEHLQARRDKVSPYGKTRDVSEHSGPLSYVYERSILLPGTVNRVEYLGFGLGYLLSHDERPGGYLLRRGNRKEGNMGNVNAKVSTVATFTKQRGPILCSEVIPEFGYIAVHFRDLTTVCYDLDGVKTQIIPMGKHMTSMRWVQDLEVLCCASVTGALHFWNLKSGLLMRSMQIHTSAISAQVYIKSFAAICTSGIDGIVCITKLKEFSDPDENRSFVAHNSVAAMMYVDCENLLVTAGADRVLSVWSAYSLEKLTSLRSHVDAVTQILPISGTPMFLTYDVAGVCNIWNCRTFANVYSFVTSSSSCAYDSSCERIILTGDALLVYTAKWGEDDSKQGTSDPTLSTVHRTTHTQIGTPRAVRKQQLLASMLRLKTHEHRMRKVD
jgi:hypothetical protein